MPAHLVIHSEHGLLRHLEYAPRVRVRVRVRLRVRVRVRVRVTDCCGTSKTRLKSHQPW